ncbi:restriction endonuclease subunit S [Sulfitobacter sp. M220]|jgi:type I restriction enzyme S subunit|uniref:restriction endonuclease subunit S n=1 Tax=unclassified Sulfitobacter TaxID=196795 RepID=UPI001EF1350B|nr:MULTISPECIES: restriction endonuclease subunit S [unclassified Sulfitobacter]MCF7727955.1 restriction endonuclease subunit S [Sulfitobacter sp. M22]MCF7776432.1 restriction endonuclease subunit S [Sulfitobacter sp. M220]
MSKMVATFPRSVQPGIPKLADTPKGWTRYKLGDLFDVVSRPLKMQDDVEYDLVTVKRSRGGITRRSRLPGRKISVQSQFYLREGDFLISKRQIVHGACGIVSAEFDGSIVSNEYAVLRPREMLLLDYLRYLSHSLYFQQTCFHASIGVHVEKMIFKLEDWFRWEIHLPPLNVQRRIVSGLIAVERKLTVFGETLSHLINFKRGVMDRIFSQEIRFTDSNGAAFPEWEKKRLADIATIVGGGTPESDVPEYWGGNIVWFTPSEIKSKFISDSQRHITQLGLKRSSAKLLPAGALILSTRATVGEVGIATRECTTNQGFQSLVVQSPHYNQFWYYWIKKYKHEFLRRAARVSDLLCNCDLVHAS